MESVKLVLSPSSRGAYLREEGELVAPRRQKLGAGYYDPRRRSSDVVALRPWCGQAQFSCQYGHGGRGPDGADFPPQSGPEPELERTSRGEGRTLAYFTKQDYARACRVCVLPDRKMQPCFGVCFVLLFQLLAALPQMPSTRSTLQLPGQEPLTSRRALALAVIFQYVSYSRY